LLFLQGLRFAVDNDRVVVPSGGENQVWIYSVAIVDELRVDDVNSITEFAEDIWNGPVKLTESNPSVHLKSVA
jgi:hypothetical protein